jgi:hypothetical protein
MTDLYIHLTRPDKEKTVGPFASFHIDNGGFVLAHRTEHETGYLVVKPSSGPDETGHDGPWYSVYQNWDTLEIKLEERQDRCM